MGTAGAVRRRMWPFFVGGGLLLIGGAFTIWYFVASSRFKGTKTKFDALVAPVVAARDLVANKDGRPRPETAFEDAGSFVKAFDSAKAGLEDSAERMANGSGLAFWFSAGRRAQSERMRAEIKALDDLSQDVRAAAAAVAPTHAEVSLVLADISGTRLSTASAFDAGSDIADFEKSIGQLQTLSVDLDKTAKLVVAAREPGVLPEAAEAFRLSILRTEEKRIGAEQASLESWTSGLAAAKSRLESYKERVRSILRANAGLVAGANDLAHKVFPVLDRAAQLTEPLLSMVQQAEQPRFGFGPFKVSAAAFAEPFLPGAGQTLSFFRGFFQGIQTARNEASGLAANTNPFLGAVRAYISEPGMARIHSLVTEADRAASYCRSKTGVFDPVIDKIDTAKSRVSDFLQVAGRVPILGDIGRAADNLLDYIETPFLNARTNIVSVAQSLGELAPMEQSYVADLRGIASGLPGFPGSRSAVTAKGTAGGGPAVAPPLDLGPLMASAQASLKGLHFSRAKREFRDIVAKGEGTPIAARARSKIRSINLMTYGGGSLIVLIVLGIPGMIWLRGSSRKDREAISLTGPEVAAPLASNLTVGGPVLRFLSGEFKGTTIPMSAGQKIVIGRDPRHANVVLSHPQMSRAHVLIRYDPLGRSFLIQDMDASHGNFVNGRRLTKGERLIATGTNTTVEMGRHIASFILINPN